MRLLILTSLLVASAYAGNQGYNYPPPPNYDPQLAAVQRAQIESFRNSPPSYNLPPPQPIQQQALPQQPPAFLQQNLPQPAFLQPNLPQYFRHQSLEPLNFGGPDFRYAAQQVALPQPQVAFQTGPQVALPQPQFALPAPQPLPQSLPTPQLASPAAQFNFAGPPAFAQLPGPLPQFSQQINLPGPTPLPALPSPAPQLNFPSPGPSPLPSISVSTPAPEVNIHSLPPPSLPPPQPEVQVNIGGLPSPQISLSTPQPEVNIAPLPRLNTILPEPSGTLVTKHVYFHVAPPEEELPPPKPITVAAPQKHYKIIFIKAPTPPTPTAPVIPVQPQDEERTLIYVLVKKPEAQPEIVVPTPAPTEPSKPEVYFIKYKSAKDVLTQPIQQENGLPLVEDVIRKTPAPPVYGSPGYNSGESSSVTFTNGAPSGGYLPPQQKK